MSPFVRCAYRNLRPSRQTKQTLRPSMKTSTKKCFKMSLDYSLKVDLSKLVNTERITGRFYRSRLYGMLESSDIDEIDNASLFYGSILIVCVVFSYSVGDEGFGRVCKTGQHSL